MGRYMPQGTCVYKIFFALSLSIFSSLSFSLEWFEVKGEVTPNNLNINTIEDKLWKYISKSSYEFHPRKSYIYQYKLLYNGELIIHAYCNMTFDGQYSFFKKSDLSKRFLGVLDGGSCYFQLRYDTSSKQFVALSVNGVA
jgi:hypothetical protein